MLVSHRYRFIFTKTVKAAGTSIEAFFERFCMHEGEWKTGHGRGEYESSAGIIGFRGGRIPTGTRWYNHMSAASIRKQLGDDIWNSYFKFTVIRNPYEKCISAFEHHGKTHQLKTYDFLTRLRTRGMTEQQRCFYDFVRRACQVDRDKYVIDGRFCLDDVIRFESLNTEIERICRRLNVPFDEKFLPHLKGKHRRPEATVENLYTPLTQQLVQKRFAYELDRFGYEFPVP